MRGEDRDVKGQGVETEPLEAQHEERAFAERANGALCFGTEERDQQIVEVLVVEAGAQPGEIVAAKPGGETRPVEQEAEERRSGPPRGAPRTNHFDSSPTLNTMIPSSRISAPLGGMALSNWKSTRRESPPSRLAGMSRT